MHETTHYMENFIKAENPIWLTIVICLFILALAFILSPSSGAKLLDLIFYKKRQKAKQKLTKKFFLSHPIHDYIAYNLSRLKTLDFGNPGKTAAMQDMLVIMLNTYQSRIKSFINQGINIMDKYALKELIQETILQADLVCEKEWLKLKIENIEIIIADVNKWQMQSVAFTRMAIYNVIDSNIYDDQLERMQEILAILETRFRVTMPEIEKGLTLANGKYKDFVYDSVFFRKG